VAWSSDDPVSTGAEGAPATSPQTAQTTAGASAFRRGLFGAFGVLLAIGVALIIQEVSSVLELVVVAGFLAVGFNPLVHLLTERGVRRGWAVVIVGVTVVGLVAAIIVVLVSVLRTQIATLVDEGPQLLRKLLENKTIHRLDAKYHVLSSLEKKLQSPDLAATLLSKTFGIGLGTIKALADTILVFVLMLYFLGALPQIKRTLCSLAPASRRERVADLGEEILHRTGRYVIGAFAVALIAGTVTLIFLLIVGNGRFALPLALLVLLLDLVPLVGSLAGASLVTLVCFATSIQVGIAAAIFYLCYELLEGYVIYPRVMRSSVDVPEYVTIIAVLVGGALDGIVGALLSLPIAAAALYLTREVWVRRQDVS
jgi:predicted PurR-regulated permease PerM